jgi:peptidoglycan/LPS O-acetylase OafA/YrhL
MCVKGTNGKGLNSLHGFQCNICYNYLQFWKDPARLYITNGTLSVDTFFVLSGLLVGYLFLKQMKHKTSGFNIPLYYLHRYIR